MLPTAEPRGFCFFSLDKGGRDRDKEEVDRYNPLNLKIKLQFAIYVEYHREKLWYTMIFS